MDGNGILLLRILERCGVCLAAICGAGGARGPVSTTPCARPVEWGEKIALGSHHKSIDFFGRTRYN